MKKRLAMVALLAVARTCFGQAVPTEAEMAVKAKVTLTDGSVLLGVPRGASLALVTAFGRQEIPLEKVASLEFVKDGVKVGFHNRDVLTGKLEGAALDIQTAFDDSVRLEYALVKAVAFSRQRNIARNANEPGLLLYAPMDTDQQNLDLFGARMEAVNTRIVEGPAGNAMLLDKADAKVTIHLPFSPYMMPEGTVEFWAKLPHARQRFSSVNGGAPLFFNIECPKARYNHHFVFGFTSNDGRGRAGLMGRFHGLAETATHPMGAVSSIAETGLLKDTPDGWHHYAFIWKYEGVDFPDARGKSLVLTVDGAIVAVGDNYHNPQQAETDGCRLVIHDIHDKRSADSPLPIAMSDLKIWGYAKPPEQLGWGEM